VRRRGDRHGEDRAGNVEADADHSRQLIRLFGSRMLVLAAWSYTARTDDEANRALGAGAAMNVIDTLTALSAARATGGTAVRGAVTSAAFAGILAAVRSLDD
jgi:hypothetical protein